MIKEKLEKEATEYADGRGHEHYKRLIEENTGSPADFARTRLYADIDAWQQRKGLSLFRIAVA